MADMNRTVCPSLSDSGDVDTRCVTLIGMPGSGKSTLAKEISRSLGWSWLDTDYLLESWFGLPLESLRNRLGRDRFLRSEEELVLDLWVRRCIVATGGSVVYSPRAMRKLQDIGPVVYLQAEPEVIASRVAQHPYRGLVMREGQDLGQVLEERKPLYEAYTDLSVDTAQYGLQDCVEKIVRQLELE